MRGLGVVIVFGRQETNGRFVCPVMTFASSKTFATCTSWRMPVGRSTYIRLRVWDWLIFQKTFLLGIAEGRYHESLNNLGISQSSIVCTHRLAGGYGAETRSAEAFPTGLCNQEAVWEIEFRHRSHKSEEGQKWVLYPPTKWFQRIIIFSSPQQIP